mmetsp:Transcript_35424/g.72411  ORF Transcript_35424/g.72411 Transcript_35424/m.72411 type:complete len:123 (+) Transcript_35424:76-444(+)
MTVKQRDVNRRLTLAVIQSRDNVAEELAKRRYLLEEINRHRRSSNRCANRPKHSSVKSKVAKESKRREMKQYDSWGARKTTQLEMVTFAIGKHNQFVTNTEEASVLNLLGRVWVMALLLSRT